MNAIKNMFTTLPRDSIAGVVVFLVALPLCLGIANASGVEPFAGLISGIIAGLVIAFISGSPLSVSGPAAGLVVIVVDGIARLDGFDSFLVAVLLAGILQLGLGYLKAGKLASYVPSPVIKGMLAAIGILLIVKQVPYALGMQTQSDSPMPVPVTIAILSLAILICWDLPALKKFKFVRNVPAPLVVVLLAIGIIWLLGHFAPGLVPASALRVQLPALDSLPALGEALTLVEPGTLTAKLREPMIWRVAATLAIVASLETLLSLEAVEQIDPLKRPPQPNRELKAQGIGNMIAGAIGGLPITSVIVRSSVNVYAGGQSRMSAVVHGALLLASIFLLTGVLNLIPLSCLAAILIHTGFKLAKPALFKMMAMQGPALFVPFLVTVSGVVALDLLFGIALGLVCSLLVIVMTNLRCPSTMNRHDDHYLLSFSKDVSFLGKVQVKHDLQMIPDGATVIIDASRADYLDHDVHELIDAFIKDAPARGIKVDYRQSRNTDLTPAQRWRLRSRNDATASATT